MPVKRPLSLLIAGVDAVSDRALLRWRRRAPRRGGLILMPYVGYANDRAITVRGRVLRERGPPREALPHDSRWRNFSALLRLLTSAEVPAAGLQATLHGERHQTTADGEGYFRFDLEYRGEPPNEIELELTAPTPRDSKPIRAQAPVLTPPTAAKFGVISDIDDTVVWTHVLSRRRMLWMLARSNAHTRKPFAGVAAFYRALADGQTGGERNPIFYVSSSPWNLYAPLADFLRINGIPQGPLFLKDWSHRTLFSRDHGTHKLAAIREILQAFPSLPFVLIGDSGEQDPEIYAQVVHDYGRRIPAIYIRDVNPRPGRRAEIDHLAAEVAAAGGKLLLVADTTVAAQHAASHGYIDALRVADVEADRRADERAPLPADTAPAPLSPQQEA